MNNLKIFIKNKIKYKKNKQYEHYEDYTDLQIIAMAIILYMPAIIILTGMLIYYIK